MKTFAVGKKLGFNKNWFNKTKHHRRIPYAAVNQSFMTCTSRCKLMPLNTRSTLYIPALTLPFSSVFFDSFSITLLYSRRRGSWLWHSPVNTNTAIICVMGVSLNLTTPIKFSLTLINTDVHCILCKVYNRVDSSNITSQTWIFYFFRFFRQNTETEFWLLCIKIPKSDYLYKYALGNLKS